MSLFARNPVLDRLFSTHIEALSCAEGLPAEAIRDHMEAGRMVLLGNPGHRGLTPCLVGQPAGIKINANLGTSPMSSCPEAEATKLEVAQRAGAHTVMDLSIAGDLDAIRLAMLERCSLPLGTVPLYAVAQEILDRDADVVTMRTEDLFTEIQKQAKQGVDFMTVHCGLTRRGADWGARGQRVMGVVSRGGSILTRWMLENDRENPLLENFDRLLDIALAHNVTLSLGDGLRPGAGVDAGDAAQWEEVITLGRLAGHALSRGVQCMIEGPGHVPMAEVQAQIRGIKRLTNGAPLYVLGPLVTDCAAGHDHIAGAIGGAMAVQAGADFLCYLTPAEHLTLPDAHDVRAGIMASRVAAHAGEVFLNRPAAVAREAAMNQARKSLDWNAMAAATLDSDELHRRREPHRHEDVCAMCGKFCAIKMTKDLKMSKDLDGHDAPAHK